MNTEEKILEMLGKHGQLLEKLDARMENLESKQAQMQDDLTSVKLRLELDVEKRFDAINEGIDAIMKKLNTLDEVKELVEKTGDKVDVIHAAVAQHGAAITELKKVR